MTELLDYLPIIIGAIIIMAIVAVLLNSRGSKEAWKAKALSQVAAIQRKATTQNPETLAHMLTQSDKLLDFVLREKKVAGATMGERLKHADKLFDHKQYNQIWEAHKLRNRLVHEMDHRINPSQTRLAISQLLAAAKQLSS